MSPSTPRFASSAHEPPITARVGLLALLHNQTLGLILGLMVGMTGLVAVPVELWLVMLATDELEPGAQQRYEEEDDWDWD